MNRGLNRMLDGRRFKQLRSEAAERFTPSPLEGEVAVVRAKRVTTAGEGLNVNEITTQTSFARNERKAAFTLAEVLITLGIIGVVAAMTMPTLIKNYQKHVTVTRLKKAYTELYQAVNMSVHDNTEVENWDYSLTAEDFFLKYLKPYIKAEKIKDSLRNNTSTTVSNTYLMPNGVTFSFMLVTFDGVRTPAISISVDINGKQGPNQKGKDRFNFYIFGIKNSLYNFGNGDVARNIPIGGLYPDGYGYTRDRMKTDTWRGCNRRGDKQANGYNESTVGAFCTALIMLDGWKISDDYKW